MIESLHVSTMFETDNQFHLFVGAKYIALLRWMVPHDGSSWLWCRHREGVGYEGVGRDKNVAVAKVLQQEGYL